MGEDKKPLKIFDIKKNYSPISFYLYSHNKALLGVFCKKSIKVQSSLIVLLENETFRKKFFYRDDEKTKIRFCSLFSLTRFLFCCFLIFNPTMNRISNLL